MDKLEAIRKILDGEKVFHIDWYEGGFIRLFGHTIIDENDEFVGFRELDKYPNEGWRIFKDN